ncbi:MAG TPA: exodeoxyribonuclease I, partial [Thiotrichales bacterium]|nr:exodeoxyribonuclease I [Thiotrichales bacterium]
LNIIGEPLTLYCKPASDMVPDPQACLVTGITPQKAEQEGLIEAEFIAKIHAEFSRPGTCVAGFNNIRFDDEFTRNTLYRNFYNAYAHEWQNGNSRWDIIDMVRLTRALRPEGIHWPEDNGRPSIRLELLTRANGISHEAAHDAMSDVYATIAVAKLIKQKQPRLYQHIYKMRKKNVVLQQFNLKQHQAVLHVSSRYSAERGAIAMVMPVCMHPTNKNAIVVYDLAADPDSFLQIDAGEIAARLYTPARELPEGVERIPLKLVHINKCPVIVPLKTMDEAAAQRLQIDVAQCEAHRQILLADIDTIVDKTTQVFEQQDFPEPADPDAQLYSGGFFSRDDVQRMDTIRHTRPEALAGLQLNFDDPRLDELLFRYRARNYPQTLAPDEQQQWRDYCRQKFNDPAIGIRTISQVRATIEEIQCSPDTTGADLVVLEELLDWLNHLEGALAT